MADDGLRPSLIRVDGGMVANDWLLQFLADILALPVERPVNVESTVLGAACLAGLQTGVYDSTDQLSALWASDARFAPTMGDERREALYRGWREAVSRVRSTTDSSTDGG